MIIAFLDNSHLEGVNRSTLDFSALEKLGNFLLLDLNNKSDIPKFAKDADVIITGKLTIDKEVIDSLPNLKLIAKAGVGCEKFDIAYANQKGIKVINLPDYGSKQVAHFTLMLILNLVFSSYQYISETKQGNWQASQFEYPLLGLAGKTVGILGLGNISRQLIPLLKSLDANCILSTKYPDKSLDVKYVSEEELARESDVLVLLSKLTKENENKINKDFFILMKKTPMLVNSARAGLVNKDDLYSALKSKQISAACFDVFWQEPPLKDDPLLALPNFFATPHMAWGTHSARQGMINSLAELIGDFFTGKVRNVVMPY